MPSPSLESSLVRILVDDQEPRQPVGAGFLVTPQHILTCAHVVNSALDRSLKATDQPAAELLFDFPILKTRSLFRAKILHWVPIQDDSAVGDLEDIAVLELLPETPLPDEAQPAPIVLPHDQSFFERRVRMCGFPVGADNGTYVNGVLQGPNAKGWVEIHHQGNEQIAKGFSGTAVWSTEENGALGMMVSILNRQNARVAYMIPAALLFRACPEIDIFSRSLNPYKGLEAFREKDAQFYFGRTPDADALRETIARQPFTAVIGASGSGKSSLVLAGVVPALRKIGDWLIADCRPKKQPFYELASCLVPLLYDDELELIKKIRQCATDLNAGELSLSDLIHRIVQKSGVQRFLLFIDQFEELYTLNTDSEARCFIDLLLEAGETELLSVVITMRADFLETALHYNAFAEALNKASIIIPPINEDGLREAVEKPAELFRVTFESGLIDLVIRDVGQEPGSLPLLEFCLTQLWERQEFRQITHTAYKDIGGVQQALANHADAVYAEFTEKEQEQLRHIFLKLVRPGQGTEDTRQVANLEQIRAEDRVLVTRLADKRLLVTGRDEECGEETIEVVHEALIHRWQTLRQWVNDEREFLVWQEKLRVLLGQWEESGKDEGALLRGLPLDEALKWQASHVEYLADEEREFVKNSKAARKKQRKRKGIAVVTGILLAAALLVTFFVLWKEAERQQVIAEQERQHAVEQQEIAEQKTAEVEQQTLATNYNLAKVFEERGQTALKKVYGWGDVMGGRRVILLASAALEQKVAADKIALNPSSIYRFFYPAVFKSAMLVRSNFSGHTSSVAGLAFSSDGKMLASASYDKTLRLWDIGSGKELSVFKGHDDVVTSVSFSPNDKQLASASWDKTVRLWDAETRRVLKVFHGHRKKVTSVSFSPDGTILASASDDKTVRLWDIENGKELEVLHTYAGKIKKVSFSPNGTRLASASKDKVWLWDTETRRVLEVFQGHRGTVNSFSFSPDDTILASASKDTVRLWDIENYKELKVFSGYGGNSVSFNPDGTKLASASNDRVRFWDVENGEEMEVFQGNMEISVSFSPDGRTIASASLADATVRLWDMETACRKSTDVFKGQNSSVKNVSFSPDGKVLASTSHNGTVRLWDVNTGKEVKESYDDTYINKVSLSPDGTKLASASASKYGVIRLWDVNTGKEVKGLYGHTSYVTGVSFSPNGKVLASSSHDETVRLWDVNTGREVKGLYGHTNSVYSVSFSPDGTKLASASSDNTVRVWDVESGKEIIVLKKHSKGVNNVSFSPDGTRLASASDDKTVRLWDVESGKELNVFKGHGLAVTNVSFSPDGIRLASASSDTIQLWNIESDNRTIALNKYRTNIISLTFNHDGTKLASASQDGRFQIWDVEAEKLLESSYKNINRSVKIGYFSLKGRAQALTRRDSTIQALDIESGKEITILNKHSHDISSISYSHDGTRLALASWYGVIRLWDVENGKELKSFYGHREDINKVSFSPDGTKLASASSDNTVRLWDVEENEKEMKVFQGHRGKVNSVSFSPDGTRLASASSDNTVRLWDIKSGKEIIVLKKHSKDVNNVSFSPDGTRLASASSDNTVRLWDVEENKKEMKVFQGHRGKVNSVSFSPDGTRLASASSDNTVRIWNIESGKEIIVLKKHSKGVNSVSFNPDGTRLASASDDKTVRLWDIGFYLLLHPRESKPTPSYHTFIEAVKFLWQLDVQGLEIVETNRRTPADLKKYGSLLAPPPPGQSKFDQVLEWAEKQQGK